MMSRPTEGYLFPAEPAAKDLRDRWDDLPREARQLEQKRNEQAAVESAKRPDRIG